MGLDDKVWQEILQFWNNPRILPPLLHEKQADAPEIIQDEIAAYVFDDRRIHVNLEKLTEILGTKPERIGAVVCHEVGHPALIPYSPALALRLIVAANNVIKNWQFSNHVENLFDDIIDNTYIVQNSQYFGKEIVNVLSGMEEMKKGRLGRLYLRTYERIWKLPEKTLVDIKDDDKVENDALKIAEIISDSTYQSSTWTTKIEKFAKIIQEYLPGNISDCTGRVRKPDALGDIKKGLQEIAQEMPLDKFKEMVAGLELGNPIFADLQYYLGLAKQYSIKMPETKIIAGELYPYTPKTWLPSDPVNRLNVPYTLQMFGKLIPGVTTRQWDYKQGVTWQQEKERPDILMVLDSSGSMPDPRKILSYPALSCFVAAESALEQGCAVAIINFSGKGQFTAEPYTYDRNVIYRVARTHFNGGTSFPSHQFISLINNNHRRQHILMISDGGVENTYEWLSAMEQGIRKAGSGTLFLSGVEHNSIDSLKKAGYKVWPMNSDKDLLSVAVAEAKELYGE